MRGSIPPLLAEIPFKARAKLYMNLPTEIDTKWNRNLKRSKLQNLKLITRSTPNELNLKKFKCFFLEKNLKSSISKLEDLKNDYVIVLVNLTQLLRTIYMQGLK